jgi:hypothetical protein
MRCPYLVRRKCFNRLCMTLQNCVLGKVFTLTGPKFCYFICGGVASLRLWFSWNGINVKNRLVVARGKLLDKSELKLRRTKSCPHGYKVRATFDNLWYILL